MTDTLAWPRLYEYALSAPLVLIIVAIEAGITDVYTLSSMFTLMACCQVATAYLWLISQPTPHKLCV